LYLLLILGFFLFERPFLFAENSGILLGHVRDQDKKPLENVRITLASQEILYQTSDCSDKNGFFQLNGIPPGVLTLLCKREGYLAYKEERVVIEPGRTLYARISLRAIEKSDSLPLRPLWADLSNDSVQTIIKQDQIEALPSGNTVWSLVQNQDFSATTNRFDVGGMRASEPALFSSRGSVSWTQTRYLINGMDVTDPYLAGAPLYYPDLYSLDFTRHSNGQHPIPDIAPGGYFDLIPKQGTAQFHGGLTAFLTTRAMTTSNITPALETEGLSETNRLNSFQNYNAQVSGPILPGRLLFFASVTGLGLSRDIAQFSPEDNASIYSGLVNLNYLMSRSSLQLFWTGQVVRQSSYGADRLVPYSATLDRKNAFHILQVTWRTQIRPDHTLQVGAGFRRGNLHSDFQEGATEPHRLEIFTKIPSGAAEAAGQDGRTALVLQGLGQALLGDLSRFHHRLDYGFSLKYSSSSSEVSILDNYHLHFYEGRPLEIVRYNTPLLHGEKSFNVNLFVQETLTFSNLASVSLGLNFISTWGRTSSGHSRPTQDPPGPIMESRGGSITWHNLSPRLAFAFPLTPGKSSWLRVSASRYYFELPLWYLAYGNPYALAELAYHWTDANHDLKFQEGEAGTLLRREGPYYARIDANIKRPYTDELTVVLSQAFPKNFRLALAGFYRETKNLVETINLGVPLSSYDPVGIFDLGDDYIPATGDELYLTVYDQWEETLGQDFFLLTNPQAGARISYYRGLDLTLAKKFSQSVVLFFSATAIEADGTTSPGNTEWENDDGVVGTLYDNPNASVYARGRLRFDRGYTARLGAGVAVPLGFRLSTLISYYDGQPFTRKIIVTGMNQGPFYVQASPRGRKRYEFNMTVDVRLEKVFNLGQAKGKIFLDGYNIFNWACATKEYEWTGPEFTLRNATEIISPRVFRLGFSYEF